MERIKERAKLKYPRREARGFIQLEPQAAGEREGRSGRGGDDDPEAETMTWLVHTARQSRQQKPQLFFLSIPAHAID